MSKRHAPSLRPPEQNTKYLQEARRRERLRLRARAPPGHGNLPRNRPPSLCVHTLTAAPAGGRRAAGFTCGNPGGTSRRKARPGHTSSGSGTGSRCASRWSAGSSGRSSARGSPRTRCAQRPDSPGRGDSGRGGNRGRLGTGWAGAGPSAERDGGGTTGHGGRVAGGPPTTPPIFRGFNAETPLGRCFMSPGGRTVQPGENKRVRTRMTPVGVFFEPCEPSRKSPGKTDTFEQKPPRGFHSPGNCIREAPPASERTPKGALSRESPGRAPRPRPTQGQSPWSHVVLLWHLGAATHFHARQAQEHTLAPLGWLTFISFRLNGQESGQRNERVSR